MNKSCICKNSFQKRLICPIDCCCSCIYFTENYSPSQRLLTKEYIPNLTERHKTKKVVCDIKSLSMHKSGKNQTISKIKIGNNVNNDKNRLALKKIEVNKTIKDKTPSHTSRKIINTNSFCQNNNKNNRYLYFNKKLKCNSDNFSQSENNSNPRRNSANINLYNYPINLKQEKYNSIFKNIDKIKDNNDTNENLKQKIDEKNMKIKMLQRENEILKKKLKKQNLKIEKEDNISLDKAILDLKKEIQDISNKLKGCIKYNDSLVQKNKELENIILNKDNEIKILSLKIEEFSEKITNIDNIIINEQTLETMFKTENNKLKEEINKLKQCLIEKEKLIKDLEFKLKCGDKINRKKQQILEVLFDFYIKIKNEINFEKNKDTLKELIEVQTIGFLQEKTEKLVKRLKLILDNIQIKFGHCFACDIACCTSHVDKMKYFRKKNIPYI